MDHHPRATLDRAKHDHPTGFDSQLVWMRGNAFLCSKHGCVNLVSLHELIASTFTPSPLVHCYNFLAPTILQTDTPVPPWVNILCGITLFFYQTLDAIDGKQARRTKSSSALGQLFDHGCDAMSTFIGAISLCVCLQTGTKTALAFIYFTCVGFFIAQWNEYYTHVLSTNVGGVFGVSEAQWTVVIVHIATALMPVGYWGQVFIGPFTAPVLGTKISLTGTDCFVYFAITMAVLKWVCCVVWFLIITMWCGVRDLLSCFSCFSGQCHCRGRCPQRCAACPCIHV